MLVNRYTVSAVNPDGGDGQLLAVAQQKRFAFKEQVTFYADEDRNQPVFGFKARQRLDIGATYDVYDAHGQVIGFFRKDAVKSFLRSTWHVGQPNLGEFSGTERNPVVAVLRRFVDALSFLPYHFDFTAGEHPVMSVTKKFPAVRDSYLLEVFDRNLDWRLAAAQAVALDALQDR
ncbi:hypothetical protein D5S17_02925 [Pseudonocardiaceae bacterium YIM PH 21723]|nr:hypothetical protein D5S17_02925 [Pseudonocardiaceae bacterium YIM PH 21723]